MKIQLINALTAVILFLMPNVNFGQVPDLGAASSFALFTVSGAFDVLGTSTNVTGDVGTNIGAFTGFPPGILVGQIHVADPQTVAAAPFVLSAYQSLDQMTCDIVLTTPLGSGQLLGPNVYCIGEATTLNGDLTLDGEGDPNALFIFQIDGALSTSVNSNVYLTNSASLCNVYWQINGVFTLGGGSVFRGNIIANGAIHLLEGSSLLGRGLSTGGAIDLHNNLVTIDLPPVTLSLTGSTICTSPGGNGTITSSTSVIGVNYQLYNSSNATVQSAKAGTGSGLTWSALAAGTGYYVIATNGENCTATSSTVNVATYANPIALILTGSIICASPGGNGTITSTTSVSGVNYQLYNSSNATVQSAKAGTGSVLTWSSLAAGTGYYVIGTNGTTFCVSPSSNAVNVATYANPIALVLTGSTICTSPGGNGTITSSTSVSGVNYQLYNSSNATVQSAQAGTGSGLTWSGIAAGTGYYVIGTYATTSCISPSSNVVDIATYANPTITTDGIVATVCYSVSGQTTTLAYSATTNSPTSYSIDWDAIANTAGLADQGNTSFTFNAGGGSLTGIAITAATAAGGPYTGIMTITDGNGCTVTQEVTVIIDASPAALTGAAREICLFASTQIGAVAVTGSTYSWTSLPAGFTSTEANPTVTPSVTTIYTIVETNTATGCQTSNSVTVTVNLCGTAIPVSTWALVLGGALIALFVFVRYRRIV